MLHLIYYLNCLVTVEDVREQNREAFELSKLQGERPEDIIQNYYTNQEQQMLAEQQEQVQDEDGNDVIMEENEDTQGIEEEEYKEDELVVKEQRSMRESPQGYLNS